MNLINKILPHCFASKKFTEVYLKELIVIPKDRLIRQSEVKGLSGEAAKTKIKEKLLECINIEDANEEEFEI